MYITSRVIYGFNLGFEVVELRDGDDFTAATNLEPRSHVSRGSMFLHEVPAKRSTRRCPTNQLTVDPSAQAQ